MKTGTQIVDQYGEVTTSDQTFIDSRMRTTNHFEELITISTHDLEQLSEFEPMSADTHI